MAKITIQFRQDSDAFAEDVGVETVRILRQLADDIEQTGKTPVFLRDSNGIPVGTARKVYSPYVHKKHTP